MKTHLIHFDSRDRHDYDETTSTSYVLPLPTTLHEVVKARLVSVEMPSSFYVFKSSYGNTDIRVTVHANDGPLTSVITIPDGNYNAITIGTQLQSSLDEAFGPLTFTVTVSQSTLQLSIENLDGYPVEVHTGDVDDHVQYAKTLAYFLGFEFDTVAKGYPLVSHHVVRMNPFTYAMLDIRELGTGSYEGGMYGSRYGPSSSVFAKIPINSNSFEYTYWEPQNTTMIDFNPVVSRLERLTIHWRFHDMTPIDFQNMDHSFTIEFITKDGHENQLDAIAEKVKFIATAMNAAETPGVSSKNSLRKDADDSSIIHKETPLITRPMLIVSSLASLIIIVWLLHRQP